MKALPDIENIILELVPLHKGGHYKEERKRHELISLIEEYFGDDAHLVLGIALYFKRPFRYSYLRKFLEEEIKRRLKDEV